MNKKEENQNLQNPKPLILIDTADCPKTNSKQTYYDTRYPKTKE